VLEEILLLYSFYKDDANMAGLLADLELLKAAYDKVEISYTYKESTMQIVDGVAVIKDNSTTTINITPQNVEEIKNVTNSIREKITS
jgi:hypothetical protein